MSLHPVSVLKCCLGFTVLSYLEPPNPLVLQSSLMAAWEHFAGSQVLHHEVLSLSLQ